MVSVDCPFTTVLVVANWQLKAALVCGSNCNATLPGGWFIRKPRARTENNTRAEIWMTLMAILTAVEPFTPRYAIYATANDMTTATNIMNAGPGLVAFMKFGQRVPTR